VVDVRWSMVDKRIQGVLLRLRILFCGTKYQ